MELVRALGCPIVLGDHDKKAAERDPANDGQKYRKGLLSGEQVDFLHSLPLVRQVNSFTVVHASLDEPENWRYVSKATEAVTSFQAQETDLCFFGHTCVPQVFILDEKIKDKVHEFFYKKIDLRPGIKYFINVGSVGQPRDGDWRAAYTIYDKEEQTVELRRLPYDLTQARAKVRLFDGH